MTIHTSTPYRTTPTVQPTLPIAEFTVDSGAVATELFFDWEGGPTLSQSDWRIDERTKQIGRTGLATVRATLGMHEHPSTSTPDSRTQAA